MPNRQHPHPSIRCTVFIRVSRNLIVSQGPRLGVIWALTLVAPSRKYLFIAIGKIFPTIAPTSDIYFGNLCTVILERGYYRADQDESMSSLGQVFQRIDQPGLAHT